MRAFQLIDYLGPEGLSQVESDPPEPTEDAVLLRVEAVGVNYPDLLLTQGKHQNKPEVPFTPGCEVAGTVISAPSGSGWHAGDRAAAFVWHGGFAEQVLVPLSAIVSIPDAISAEAAAAMVVNYHTVHFALARRGNVRPGETVFVMGAGGGIGTAAVQVAKGLGARVIAGAADDKRAEIASRAGAEEIVRLEPGFSQELREVTAGRGVDVVLDPVGDWLFDEAIRAIAPEGRMLVVGFAAGKIPEIKVNRLLLRNIGVIGVAFGAFLDVDDSLMRRQGTSLDKMIADGTVNPLVGDRFDFDELPTAYQMLERGAVNGKAVVVVDGERSTGPTMNERPGMTASTSTTPTTGVRKAGHR